MRTFELILCALLAVSAVLHAFGSFAGYPLGSEVLVWALAASGFCLSVVFLNVLRVLRRDDVAVTWGALVGTLAWIAVALGFGGAEVGYLDFRVLIHAILAAALVVTTLIGMRSGTAATHVA
jgi:putative effector of murein hydrolase